jgi:RNA polymerase sigma-B factor
MLSSASMPGDERAARRREERRLLLRYHVAGDEEAREALVHRFLPLARMLARRYQIAGEPIDDLVQVASLGLLKAIDRFDPTRETTLSTFAIPTIAGELKRYFRDHGWIVRVPRALQESALRVERATDALWAELGRMPTAAEVASWAETTPERVIEARQAAGARHAVSLDLHADDPEGGPRFGIEEPGFSRAEDAATVERLMTGLGEREREVLRLRFGEDLMQSEIGERLGISQMQVSRLLRQSIADLQEMAAQT